MAIRPALTKPALRLVQPLPPPEGGPPALAPKRANDLRTPVPAALDDSEILAAIARGDESAVGALHDRVRPQIDRTILRLLGRHDVDHEDVAQIALVELVRSLPRFRGECSLDTWTSRITAHAVWKEIRHRRVDRKLFEHGVDSGELHAAGPCDVERESSMRNLLGRVRCHLDALEENKAWTVLLHDVCGYDLREIGEITKVSVAAAQTRLVRGRRELHERIASDPELAELIEEWGGAR